MRAEPDHADDVAALIKVETAPPPAQFSRATPQPVTEAWPHSSVALLNCASSAHDRGITVPRPAPLVLSVIVLCASLVVVSGAAAATPRCAGERATIASSARKIVGTPGRDVIVARRGGVVRALGGDDTVCLRGEGSAFVDAGSGDDTVLSQGRGSHLSADLGSGRDTYLGGPGRDMVDGGGGSDTISTGAGADTFVADRGSTRDTVDLGAGRDLLAVVTAADHAGASVAGGAGEDTVVFDVDSELPMTLDASSGTAALSGRAFLRWAAFEDYAVDSYEHGLTFTGSTADEELLVYGRGLVAAAMGDGDDEVYVNAFGESQVTVDGGAGLDALSLSSASDIVGSVPTSTVSDDQTTVSFGAIERLSAVGEGSVTLTGGDLADDLQANGCRVTLRGGGGNDALRVGFDPAQGLAGGFLTEWPTFCDRPTSRVYGEAGDDTLISRVLIPNNVVEAGRGASVTRGGWQERPVTDLLDGGDGIDVARAGKGRDTCIAETRVACEL